MTPVCCTCHIEMRVRHNGVVAVMMAEYGPLEIRRADMFSCPECSAEALIQFAEQPEIRHTETAFAARLDSYENDKRFVVIRFWHNQAAKEKATQLKRDEK